MSSACECSCVLCRCCTLWGTARRRCRSSTRPSWPAELRAPIGHCPCCRMQSPTTRALIWLPWSVSSSALPSPSLTYEAAVVNGYGSYGADMLGQKCHSRSTVPGALCRGKRNAQEKHTECEKTWRNACFGLTMPSDYDGR